MVTRNDIEKLMKILTILGAIVAIIEAAIGLSNFSFNNIPYSLITHIVAIIIAILCLLSAIRPSDPIPFNWIILLIFSIVLIIFRSTVGGILIIIAAILGILVEVDVL
ncbi:MAG: hypothetical protein P8Y70_03790 [Candidatus Lokiarchaeota archaeon]